MRSLPDNQNLKGVNDNEGCLVQEIKGTYTTAILVTGEMVGVERIELSTSWLYHDQQS